MNKIPIIYLNICVLGILTLSCRTDGSILKDDTLRSFTPMAKVFNGENRSCPGVLVTVTAKNGHAYQVQTDITDKALFPPLPFDSYQVLMTKKGYERVSFSFEYSRPDQALYGRLYSFEHLINQCARNMDKQEWSRAESWLDRAESLESNESLTVFYRSVILWKTGFPWEAAARLEQYGREKGPLRSEVAQFLKDLYIYDLKEELIGTAE
jgi:hypothetical protein